MRHLMDCCDCLVLMIVQKGCRPSLRMDASGNRDQTGLVRTDYEVVAPGIHCLDSTGRLPGDVQKHTAPDHTCASTHIFILTSASLLHSPNKLHSKQTALACRTTYINRRRPPHHRHSRIPFYRPHHTTTKYHHNERRLGQRHQDRLACSCTGCWTPRDGRQGQECAQRCCTERRHRRHGEEVCRRQCCKF